MNPKALYKLGYGLYVVTSKKGDKHNGQIANTVFQITSEPPTVAVSINKKNLTWEYIKESRGLRCFRHLSRYSAFFHRPIRFQVRKRHR